MMIKNKRTLDPDLSKEFAYIKLNKTSSSKINKKDFDYFNFSALVKFDDLTSSYNQDVKGLMTDRIKGENALLQDYNNQQIAEVLTKDI